MRFRGFPSPSLHGFGFIVICCAFFIRLAAENNLIVNIIGVFQATGNVGFGSLADHQDVVSSMAAFECKTGQKSGKMGCTIEKL